jgi:hypothetical protein
MKEYSKSYLKYCERQSWYPDSNENWLCVDCRTVFKQRKRRDECDCPNCKGKMKFIGIFLRVPRKRASNRAWKKFLKDNYLNYNNFKE